MVEASPAMIVAAPPEPPRIQRLPLKPRAVEKAAEMFEVTPLKPRPKPAPPAAAPTPEPKPIPAPKKTLTEQAIPKQVASLPRTKPNLSTAAQSTPVSVTRKTVKEGCALLKMLETGKDPMIKIAWPQTSADRYAGEWQAPKRCRHRAGPDIERQRRRRQRFYPLTRGRTDRG